MIQNLEVIDFHCHLSNYQCFTPTAYAWFAHGFTSPEEYNQKIRYEYESSEKFLEFMQKSGVDYTVILAEMTPLTTGLASNEMVENFCRNKKSLIPFCTFNPYTDEKMGDSLKILCRQHGFKGLKLYPPNNYFYPNDPKLYPAYAAAQELGIPVMFHTGSSVFQNTRIKYGNPLYFDDVAVDFPELNIIMAHGGRGVWYDEAMLMVRLHKNVHIDISGLPPQKLLTYFPEMERFADKFIFGSDWPGADVKQNLETLCDLPISREAKEKILSGNAKKVLGLL
jgi:predicted TIM-barrel fold metal-dependent hydrolase